YDVPFAVLGVQAPPGSMRAVLALYRRVRVPLRALAHSLVPTVTGLEVRFDRLPRSLAQRRVGISHDAFGDARIGVLAAGTHRRHPDREFRFADVLEMFRAPLAVHHEAFDEDGGDDVMPA